GDADWLDGAFSAGDLMMVSVLLRLRASGILDEFPNLAAYVARGEARAAYKRAFDAQLAVNTGRGEGAWVDRKKLSAGGGIRTLTLFRAADFESAMSAVPSLRRGAQLREITTTHV